ncbi:MAG: hypothetical protein AABZ47_15635, partial [Planctomycetota bacterium]
MINIGIAFAALVLRLGEIDYGRFVTIAEEGELALEVRPYETTIVEKAPVIVRIRLKNLSHQIVHTFFKEGRDLKYTHLFSLHAT